MWRLPKLGYVVLASFALFFADDYFSQGQNPYVLVTFERFPPSPSFRESYPEGI